MSRTCPETIGPIKAPTEYDIDKNENVRPYRLALVTPARKEAIAGKITPFAIPIRNSETDIGSGQCTDMPKKVNASAKLPNDTRQTGDTRFKNNKLSVTSDPKLTKEKNMPEVIIELCVSFISGSSKNRMPWEQERASGMQKNSHGIVPDPAAVSSSEASFEDAVWCASDAFEGSANAAILGAGLSLTKIEASTPVVIKPHPK